MKFTKAQLRNMIIESLSNISEAPVDKPWGNEVSEALASALQQTLLDLLQENYELLASKTTEVFMGNTLNDPDFRGYPGRIEDVDGIAQKATEHTLKSGVLDELVHQILKSVLKNTV